MEQIKLSSWPSFTAEESHAVHKVLMSNKVNYWTGNECREFEKEFASFSDCDYAIAVANGTVALDLALHALGIGPDDEVVVTSRTFIASVSSIVNTGATPVFADVDPDSQNITPESIKAVLTSRTTAIVCVHLAGWPCEMAGIMALADKHNLKVIEDCAQAHGAAYQGKSVGSIGHVGAWSFCQDKIMSTGGEGGMVTTNNRELWQSMWSYKDHGKSYEAVYEREHPPGFRWLHESFGTNWRMTEIQAAIGRVQLQRMPQWTKQRAKNAQMLRSCMGRFDFLRIPVVPDYIGHANYKFYVFIAQDKLPEGENRDSLVSKLSNSGIPCFQGSCSEVYLERAFDGTPFRPAKRLKMAKKLGETSMMFLVHPTISSQEMAKVCQVIDGELSQMVRSPQS